MTIEPEDPSQQGQNRPQDSTTDTRPGERSPSVIRRHGGRVVEIRLDDDTVDERASPDRRRDWIEDDPASHRQYVDLLDAQTRNIDAQTRAQTARNQGRAITGHNVVRIIAAVVWAAAVLAWLGFVLAGADETALTAVSAVAIVATNFAVAVLVRGGGKGDDGDDTDA